MKAQTNAKWMVKDGWAWSKSPNDKAYKKFFAIGLWGLPGYSFNRLTEKEEQKQYPENPTRFGMMTKYFNLFFLQSGYGKEYMQSPCKMIGTKEFQWFLENELYNEKRVNSSYQMMRKIEQDVKTKKFSQLLDGAINTALGEIQKINSDYIWNSFDEAASGTGNWCWPVKISDFIYTGIKKKNPDKLVYLDLFGSDSGIGNSYLFEKFYRKKKGTLPVNPPFDNMIQAGDDRTLENLHYNYKGISAFRVKQGQRTSIFNINSSSFENDWYENVKSTAEGYKNSGDIFGMNSYSKTFMNPSLAGITVDAIKAGTGKNPPVWLFFDSNGYDKPEDISTKDYVKNLKCQIYISIVHGATGVLFWSDLTKNSDVFDSLLSVIAELKQNEPILCYETIVQKKAADIHYMIKKSPSGDKYMIAVNTNKLETQYLINSYSNKTTFKPLEVFVSKIQ